MSLSVEKLTEAADHIMTLASRYEALVRVSQLLKELGSVEQHVVELTKKKNTLLDQLEDLEKTAESVKADKQAQIDALELKMVETSEQAARLEISAQEKIQAMFTKAETDAQLNVQAIYDAKVHEINELDAQVSAARGNLGQINSDIAALESEKVRVAAETESAKAGLAEVLRTIEQLSKFGSVPGGSNGEE